MPKKRRRRFVSFKVKEALLLSSLCSAPRALFSVLCSQGACVDAPRAATMRLRATSASLSRNAERMNPARGRKKKSRKTTTAAAPAGSSFSKPLFSLSSFSSLPLSLSLSELLFFFPGRRPPRRRGHRQDPRRLRRRGLGLRRRPHHHLVAVLGVAEGHWRRPQERRRGRGLGPVALSFCSDVFLLLSALFFFERRAAFDRKRTRKPKERWSGARLNGLFPWEREEEK